MEDTTAALFMPFQQSLERLRQSYLLVKSFQTVFDSKTNAIQRHLVSKYP